MVTAGFALQTDNAELRSEFFSNFSHFDEAY